MLKMNPQVDEYIQESGKWGNELRRLRAIILGFDLTEEFKWAKPCYTWQKSNVMLLMQLKDHCALMFCKGALLKDAAGLLTKPGENTQAGRWIKFDGVREIVALESSLKTYLAEAIEVEKAGLEVTYKKVSEFSIPAELQRQLEEDPTLKEAFDALTPGRQRGYLLHFSAPKQEKTRESRVEKCRSRILAGKGLTDR